MITDKIEKNKFLLIAGPCAIEGEKDIAFEIAHKLIDINSKLSNYLLYLKVVIGKRIELD